MDQFSELTLTAARRPVLVPGETILVMQKGVGLYEGKTRLQNFDDGIAFVTSHRLFWVAETRGNGLQMSLSLIKAVTSANGIWKASSPKITLTLTRTAGTPVKSTISSPATPSASRAVDASTEWTCAICMHKNVGDDVKCALCGVQKTLQQEQAKPKSSAEANTIIFSPNQTSPAPDGRASPSKAPPKACPVCTFLNHPELLHCEMCDSALPSSDYTTTETDIPNIAHRITSVTIDTSENAKVQGATDLPRSASADSLDEIDEAGRPLPVIKLSFRGGGMSEFLKALKTALSARAWEQTKPADSPTRPVTVQPSPGLGGIASIMRSVEQSNQLMGNTLEAAFSDLNALMAKAADMVKLAESISTKLAQSASSEGDESSEMATFRTYLVDLGISNPVTKKATGDLYSTELARQLAEFLERVLSRHGGMMALTDLYCLFNRARGTALISPNDLRKCCSLFEELRLPYRLRRFDSGLLVVQASNHNDDATAHRVQNHVKAAGDGLRALDLASLEKVSVVLAIEQLLLAESRGLICRDDSIEGLRFFDNIFKNF